MAVVGGVGYLGGCALLDRTFTRQMLGNVKSIARPGG